MKKIRITEHQAKLLRNLNKGKKIKITKEQYNRIVESNNLELPLFHGEKIEPAFDESFEANDGRRIYVRRDKEGTFVMIGSLNFLGKHSGVEFRFLSKPINNDDGDIIKPELDKMSLSRIKEFVNKIVDNLDKRKYKFDTEKRIKTYVPNIDENDGGEYPVIFKNSRTGEFAIGTAENVSGKSFPRAIGQKFRDQKEACKFFSNNRNNIVSNLSELDESTANDYQIVDTQNVCGFNESVDSQFKKSFADKGDTKIRNFKSVHDKVGKKLSFNETTDDYKPQTVQQNKETYKSFKNEDVINESLTVDLLDFSKHIIELLKEILSDPSQKGLSPFFQKLGITRGELFTMMSDIGLITFLGAQGYRVLKSDFAKKLKELYNQIVNKPEKEISEEDKEEAPKIIDPKYKPLKTVSCNKEIAILKDDSGKKFVFFYGDKNIKDFKEYSNQEDNEVNYNVIDRYVNNNLGELSKGKGLKSFENGKDLVLLDDALKAELLDLYDKDKDLKKVLGNTLETTTSASSGQFTGSMTSEPVITRKMPSEELHNLLDEEELDEVTVAGASADGGSSGPYVTPKIWAKSPESARFAHKPMFKGGEIVNEDVDQYGSLIGKWIELYTLGVPEPKLSKISNVELTPEKYTHRFVTLTISNGGVNQIPLKSMNDFLNHKEIKLNGSKGEPYIIVLHNDKINETKTTYPNGELVSFDDCVKLNNNKSAENGGCSTGAVDNVVKTTKTNDSIIKEENNLTLQQQEYLKKLDNLSIFDFVKHLNYLKYNPDTIGLVFKKSKWYKDIGYDAESPIGKWVITNQSLNEQSNIKEAYKLGKGYTHFAILKRNNKIVDGWDYKGTDKDDIKYYSTMDLKDNFPENKLSEFKIVSRTFLMRNNIDPSDTNNWNHEPVNNKPINESIIKEVAEKTGKSIQEVERIIRENVWQLFDITNVEEAVNLIKDGINAPEKSIKYSTLGGDRNVSVMMAISLDPKDQWPNNIFENSRYLRFRLDNSGIIELFAKSHKITLKFRKTKVKSIQDVISKINNYIEQINNPPSAPVDEEIQNAIKKVDLLKYNGKDLMTKLSKIVNDFNRRKDQLIANKDAFNNYLEHAIVDNFIFPSDKLKYIAQNLALYLLGNKTNIFDRSLEKL